MSDSSPPWQRRLCTLPRCLGQTGYGDGLRIASRQGRYRGRGSEGAASSQFASSRSDSPRGVWCRACPVLRDYRNYIHPEKELSHGITVDAQDTAMFVSVFSSIADQIIASVK